MTLGVFWLATAGIALVGALWIGGPSARRGLTGVPQALGGSSRGLTLPSVPVIVAIALGHLLAVAVTTATLTTLFNLLAPRVGGIRVDVLELEHTEMTHRPELAAATATRSPPAAGGERQ